MQKSFASVVDEKLALDQIPLWYRPTKLKTTFERICLQIILLHPKTKLKNIHRNTKILVPNKIKFTMFGIQSKIIRYAKKENVIYNKEKKMNYKRARSDTDDRISR